MWSDIREICPDLKFRLVPFENTRNSSVEILKNLGQNIDIVAGVFDDNFLKVRKCNAFLLSHEPVCCTVSVYNELTRKPELNIYDLYGIIHR